jgi:hypothetical protein
MNRGKGKTTGELRKKDFYNYYVNNSKEPIISQSVYNKFLKELLNNYSKEIVEKGLELRLNKLGKIRVRTKELHYFNKEGKRAKSIRVNWKATLEYWKNKYPELTKKELKNIKNKPLLYHDNEHSNGEFYEHYWDNSTANVKYKSFYNFSASRQYSRLIAKVVKDPNRKTFYYG